MVESFFLVTLNEILIDVTINVVIYLSPYRPLMQSRLLSQLISATSVAYR